MCMLICVGFKPKKIINTDISNKDCFQRIYNFFVYSWKVPLEVQAQYPGPVRGLDQLMQLFDTSRGCV